MSQSTKDLSQELSQREGVETIAVEPHQEFKITVGQQEQIFTGPAVILVNQD
ncbi:BC1881 family protein [Paenibacillus polysaccharolyticus]|uniref:BC1881 family protein n=1 Tax=Paenibacillus polysaccharolyticus TaxID=582692 RepID=UPI00209EF0D6|nr:BC1881 family protein [Paenibacillus polysaccharolyticus]MCP1134902.1 BC1881 family protein [Paenibacillus polysaccharolyticus]